MKLQSRMRMPGDRDVLQRTGSEGPSEERHLQRLKQAEAASGVGAAAILPSQGSSSVRVQWWKCSLSTRCQHGGPHPVRLPGAPARAFTCDKDHATATATTSAPPWLLSKA